MENLLAARAQMGMALGFHIVFAAAGIALPLLMVIAEWRWLMTGREVYLTLAKRWAKGAAILFAVGAVSGTVLSFELGVLFRSFMGYSGAIIGMPFSLEGFAFFTEAIFLGIYLYGWKRVPPLAHWLSGVAVAFSGMISGVFVVIANAWMNCPRGFEMDVTHGTAVNIDPVAAMLNPMAFSQCLHMTIAAYAATGFLAAGVHAFFLLRNRNDEFHRCALGIALSVGGIAAILQPISGDLSAQAVAKYQPAKLAAMEGLFKTQTRAPLCIGGIPDEAARETKYCIEIPGGLSFLAYHDFNAEVKGLDAFPREHWPNPLIVHLSFQAMVGLGTLMMLVGAWGALAFLRTRKLPDGTWYLRTLLVVAPAGMIALEAGWFVTEFGRQPWIVQGVMLTKDAVTPMPGLTVTFLFFTGLYLALSAMVVWLLVRQFKGGDTETRGHGDAVSLDSHA